MSSSLFRYLLATSVLLIHLWSPTDAFFFWPTKLQPFFHPSSSSASFPSEPPSSSSSGVHSRPNYQYDWNQYQQSQMPNILFPNRFSSHHFQQHHPGLFPAQESPLPTSSSLLSGLFKKPWLGWKLNKFNRFKSPCFTDPIEHSQLPCLTPCCGFQQQQHQIPPQASVPEQSIIQTTVQHTRPSYDRPYSSSSNSFEHPHFAFYPPNSFSAVAYVDETPKLLPGATSGMDEPTEYISS